MRRKGSKLLSLRALRWSTPIILGVILATFFLVNSNLVAKQNISQLYPGVLPSNSTILAAQSVDNSVDFNLAKLKSTTSATKSSATQLTSSSQDLGNNYMGISLQNTTNTTTTNSTPQLAQLNFQSYTVSGIDVSKWQGTIDWAQVKNAGYSFAYIKSTEGYSYADPKFLTNIYNAKNNHLLVAPYHFARPDLATNPVSEATWFANNVSSYLHTGYLKPVLDLERKTTDGSWASTSTWTETFMQTFYNLTGVRPMIYMNSNFANNLDSYLSKYDLWIAHWQVSAPNDGKWTSWQVWQWTGGAGNVTVPGITTGAVDQDVFNGDSSLLYRITLDSNKILLCHSLDCANTAPKAL